MAEPYWGQGSKSSLLYEVRDKNVLYEGLPKEEAKRKASSERRLTLYYERGE